MSQPIWEAKSQCLLPAQAASTNPQQGCGLSNPTMEIDRARRHLVVSVVVMIAAAITVRAGRTTTLGKPASPNVTSEDVLVLQQVNRATGQPRVAILTAGSWQRLFGSRLDVLGTAVWWMGVGPACRSPRLRS